MTIVVFVLVIERLRKLIYLTFIDEKYKVSLIIRSVFHWRQRIEDTN